MRNESQSLCQQTHIQGAHGRIQKDESQLIKEHPDGIEQEIVDAAFDGETVLFIDDQYGGKDGGDIDKDKKVKQVIALQKPHKGALQKEEKEEEFIIFLSIGPDIGQ